MRVARANLKTAEQYIARQIPFKGSNFYGETVVSTTPRPGFFMMLGGEVVPATATYLVYSYNSIIAYQDRGRLYITSSTNTSQTTRKHINICKPGAYWAGTNELAR